MSLLQHAFGARPVMPPIRRTVGRTLARLILGFPRRADRLIEDEMPDWQLRDLGLRDGRSAMPPGDASAWGRAAPYHGVTLREGGSRWSA